MNSDIPGEALIRFSGYFVVCQTAISGFADKLLELKNVLAFTITTDTGEDFRKNFYTVDHRSNQVKTFSPKDSGRIGTPASSISTAKMSRYDSRK